MPLLHTDPQSGVIVTDWYMPQDSPDERVMIDIYVLSGDLRVGISRVSVFRQDLNGAGGWIDAPVEGQARLDLENSILLRAREIRIACGL